MCTKFLDYSSYPLFHVSQLKLPSNTSDSPVHPANFRGKSGSFKDSNVNKTLHDLRVERATQDCQRTIDANKIQVDISRYPDSDKVATWSEDQNAPKVPLAGPKRTRKLLVKTGR